MQPHEITTAIDWRLDSKAGNLSDQLVALIRRSISSGELASGDRLPSTRTLATELGIARGTVTTAFELLTAEGLLESRVGSGCYVSADAESCSTRLNAVAASLHVMPKRQPQPDIDTDTGRRIDFRPCEPSLEIFPLAAWRRCLAAAARALPSGDYGDPRGDERLRSLIAAYLRRARGLALTSDQIIITNGAIHSIHLLSSLYLDRQARVVVENPGYPLARQTFELAGATIVPCPVDNDGLILDALPTNTDNVRFVCVTPSHQFPTGSRLSLGRRRALIKWAEQRDILVIEDDYDGEFRYDVAPLAPLAALPNRCVVYCGTFSKTLFPGLRTGYAVAPKPLIDALASIRTISEYSPNAITQLALARFIEEGHYERHVHRMRRRYARKRQVLADSLASTGFPGTLEGLESGLNGLVRLNRDLKASDLAKKAAQAGVYVPTIQRYAADASVADNAIVLGYSALSENNIKRGVESLFFSA